MTYNTVLFEQQHILVINLLWHKLLQLNSKKILEPDFAFADTVRFRCAIFLAHAAQAQVSMHNQDAFCTELIHTFPANGFHKSAETGLF